MLDVPGAVQMAEDASVAFWRPPMPELGTIVLQPVLEICDASGIRAYLESSNPRNMTLYRRHGFVDSGEITLPGGPSLYPMWRDPRTS